jgi:hypothetical protein
MFEPNYVPKEFVVKLISMWRIIGSSQKLVISDEIEDVQPNFGLGLQTFLDSGFFTFKMLPQSDFNAQLSLITNNETLDRINDVFSDEESTAPKSDNEVFQMLRSRLERYRANATLFLVSANFPERKFINGVMRMTCRGIAQHEILMAYDFFGSAWQFLYPQLVS